MPAQVEEPSLPSTRVVLLVRQGCHLCDDAEAVVADVCTSMKVAWSLVDVDECPALRAVHGDHVPVTVVDGSVVARWFLDGSDLRSLLSTR